MTSKILFLGFPTVWGGLFDNDTKTKFIKKLFNDRMIKQKFTIYSWIPMLQIGIKTRTKGSLWDGEGFIPLQVFIFSECFERYTCFVLYLIVQNWMYSWTVLITLIVFYENLFYIWDCSYQKDFKKYTLECVPNLIKIGLKLRDG